MDEEIFSSRLQMAEYRHRDRILTTSRGDELLEDSHLYLGTGEARGLACIALMHARAHARDAVYINM